MSHSGFAKPSTSSDRVWEVSIRGGSLQIRRPLLSVERAESTSSKLDKQQATSSKQQETLSPIAATRLSPIADRLSPIGCLLLAACFLLLYGTCLGSNLGMCMWYGMVSKHNGILYTRLFSIADRLSPSACRRSHIAYRLIATCCWLFASLRDLLGIKSWNLHLSGMVWYGR